MNNLLILLLAFLLISIVPSRSEEPALSSCGLANATAQMSKNIGYLLPMLVNATARNGSNLANYGENESKIYGLAQCIGDVPKGACLSCIKNATCAAITKYCPTQSDVTIWYDYCLLRYSTSNFYGEAGGGALLRNTGKVTHSYYFNGNLTALMTNITTEAVGKGFGKGMKKLEGDDVTIYGMLQCTMDLMDSAYMKCGECLDMAKKYIEHGGYCYNHKGCRVFMNGCFLRYEVYTFFYNATSYDKVVDVILD